MATAEPQGTKQGTTRKRQKQFEINKFNGRPMALVMVGLPARGKSYIARRVHRYLNWLGIPARLFSLTENCEGQPQSPDTPSTNRCRSICSMNPGNDEGHTDVLLDRMCAYIEGREGSVAIMDAHNVQVERRVKIKERLSGVFDSDRIIFMEVMHNEQDRIREIVQDRVERTSSEGSEDTPDSPKIEEEYFKNIKFYSDVYVPLSDEEREGGSKDEAPPVHVQFIDRGRALRIRGVCGYVPTRIVSYVNHLALSLKPIYVSRHGQSEYNELGKLGGDSNLTSRGKEYAKAVLEFVEGLGLERDQVAVWTSTLKRTRQTALHLAEAGYHVTPWRALDEINAGICDGLTYKEVEQRYPEEFALRAKDKYDYRYPKGESYHDLVQRIEPVMMELERVNKTVVMICHQAVLRVVVAYLLERLPAECVREEIPLHTMFKIRSNSTGDMTIQANPLLG